MKPKIGLNLFLMIPLLLITEGHVSSGISRVSFEQLVNRSDAVLLVSKNTPYMVPFNVKYSDSLKDEFESKLYSFQIKSVIMGSEGLIKGKEIINVHPASDAGNFDDMKDYLEGGPLRMRIHDYYDSKSKDPELEKEFLIFIKFDEDKGWISFTAGSAMESKEMANSIWSTIPRPKVPD